MLVNKSLQPTDRYKKILLFASVFFWLQILVYSVCFAQEKPLEPTNKATPITSSGNNKKSSSSSDNKKGVAKSTNLSSPSPSPIPSVTPLPKAKIAKAIEKDPLEDEAERQAQMMRNGLDFAKKNFPLIILCGVGILIIGYNFKKLLPEKKSISHGSAHFATRSEIKDYLKPMYKPIEPGHVRAGIYREKWRLTHKYLDLPRKIVTRHILVVGPSGAGKSTAIYLPNCHHNKGASYLCTDPKSELWNQTSGHQENPIRFAPMEPDSSMGFNPIPACSDVDVAERLAIAIVYARGETGDPFWYQNERQLLTALIVHTATSDVPTLTHLYEILCLGGKRLVEVLQESKNISAKRLSTSFVGLNEKVLTGTVQGLTGKLSWLENPKVRRFTSSLDYTFDFAKLRAKPTQLYWCLNEDDVSKLTELTAAFFNMAMVALKRANGKIPVTFYFDEFGNIGKLSNFEKDITLIRGRDLAVVACLQNIAQLESLYGKVNAKIIWANFNTKFLLNGLENETAEAISKTLGNYTYIQEKLAKSRKGDSWLGASSTTESDQHNARALKTPDELRTHPMKEMIVVSTDINPINIERIYYKEPICAVTVTGCDKEIPVPSYTTLSQ